LEAQQGEPIEVFAHHGVFANHGVFAHHGEFAHQGEVAQPQEPGRRSQAIADGQKKARLRQARRLLIVPFKTKIFLYTYDINALILYC
jgi:hypothetical protein